jgi:hypothetical protein
MKRILIAIIAVVWGLLVFLPGSVLVEAAALMAALEVVPLVIAAILANDNGKIWRKYLRR